MKYGHPPTGRNCADQQRTVLAVNEAYDRSGIRDRADPITRFSLCVDASVQLV
jgi:hypothetical protein